MLSGIGTMQKIPRYEGLKKIANQKGGSNWRRFSNLFATVHKNLIVELFSAQQDLPTLSIQPRAE